MAGLRGNQAWVLAQKQVSKGTVPTISATLAYKMPLSGGSIGPVRETDQLAETDASRDRGDTYVVSGGVEGSPEFYVRTASASFWLWAALGQVATTGTGPNYTHAITPGNGLPYITVWRSIADTLWEQYRDCKVGSLTIGAEAGAPLTMTAGIQGLKSTRLTATPDSVTPIDIASGTPFNFNDATVTISGGATALVRSFELTIENNLTRQQTDDVEPYDITEGQREVSLTFDLIFETLAEYNKFYYGGSAGVTTSSQVYSTPMIFEFAPGGSTTNTFGFNIPGLAYTEFPVEPNVGGDPIVSSVAGAAQRQAAGAPIMTATVKNQVALI